MVYTKTGDNGTTSLIEGTRVPKDDPRVEAYGTVDELGAQVAVLIESLPANSKQYADELKEVQYQLFNIQTLLAAEHPEKFSNLSAQLSPKATALENQIDEIEKLLPKNNAFIIPGGTFANAQCHVARCVCRRAERRCVTLAKDCAVDPMILKYLNRLSDYLFVLSRRLVHLENKLEFFWHNT